MAQDAAPARHDLRSLVQGGLAGMLLLGSLLAWVGDVRLYRWRDGRLDLLSEDHIGEMRYGEARGGEAPAGQDDLTRLVGADEPLPDMALLRVRHGDRYLLCSDGLHAEIGERRLAHWLARDPLQAQRELVAEALAAGGRDNLSFILLEVEVSAGDTPREVPHA